MARPRAATYDDQRSQILKAAADLFARRGYTAATLNEVASASGVSKATLYHYFSDKHALLEDIVSSHVTRLQRIVAEAGAASKEFPEGTQVAADARLRSLVRRFMQAYADAQSEHRVLTEDVKFLDKRARGAVLDGQRQVVGAFAQGIAACRPGLPAELHKPMAMLLFGMINWTFTWLRPDGVLTYADLGDIVADLFFGGLPAVAAGLPVVGAPGLAQSQADSPPAGLR
ncbi:MAG: TetR/AcrR family transcriptional regulator [Betaproteobacteria bacterium]